MNVSKSTEFMWCAVSAIVLTISAGACTRSSDMISENAPNVACAVSRATPKRDFRAFWIAAVRNIDWPSREGLTVAEQQEELRKWLDLAVRLRYNAVILQVRPVSDSFWPSPFAPWSEFLTGTQGTDPGYDPLAFAVAEAHRRNLELHAWFNPYRAARNTQIDLLAPTHPARLHRDWLVSYDNQLYFNPGVPAAREHIVDAIMDAVDRYDVDGVHLDDFFYPYPIAGETFADTATYMQYGAGFTTLADWRRHNVDVFVEMLSRRIKAVKPWVKFGISPFAVWRNASVDPQGSETSTDVQTYDDQYADTRRWLRENWIDYIAPQVYWAQDFQRADYDKVVSWWVEQVRSSRAHLYIGQAAYKVGISNQSPGWASPAELANHLAFNCKFPEVKGNIYFSAKDVRADRLGSISQLGHTWYSRPALPPIIPWLKATPPLAVRDLQINRKSHGVRLSWQAGSADTVSYAIYRHEASSCDACRDLDASHLIATVRRTEYLDAATSADREFLYSVTALDRVWNESEPVVLKSIPVLKR
ncbi:glycoside hydrolase family 10 protein [Burkholderia oklahomensis]|uniref:Glycosyl hydrolase like GH101 family protein n=1 Tax=Burkholderia oklahomensis TaxID=342113 RepID=A0AAI8BC63_9BURK|nr:family 10 glycosylhydrolase [Burkholderia oklahomensis]AIO69523.1 glycosyl hydrolase like GH101 family protein [Burkholderia oklahomensis]QPS40296.1 family 10 glycosylhydrolase [Burkholderia oklahomensis]